MLQGSRNCPSNWIYRLAMSRNETITLFFSCETKKSIHPFWQSFNGFESGIFSIPVEDQISYADLPQIPNLYGFQVSCNIKYPSIYLGNWQHTSNSIKLMSPISETYLHCIFGILSRRSDTYMHIKSMGPCMGHIEWKVTSMDYAV